MSDEMAQQVLVSRIIDACGEGLTVKVLLQNGSKYGVKEPISAGGILSFTAPDETLVRVLESAIIGFEEDEPFD